MRGPSRESLLIALIAFIGILDTSAMIPTIAAYARSLGASEFEAGLITGMYSYVALLASVAAGLAVDLIGRKRAMVLGLLWDAVIVALYALARSPLHLAALRGLHALGGSLVYPAVYARAAGGRNLDVRRLSLALAATALAVAFGIMLGGVAAHVVGFRALYAALACALAVGALAAMLLPGEAVPGERRAGALEVLRGLRRAGPLVALGSYTIFAAYVGLGVVTGGLPTALVRDGLAASEHDASRIAGVMLGAMVVLSALVILALGRTYTPRRGMALMGASAAAGSLCLALYHVLGPSHAYAALAVAGGGVALGSLILASTVLVASAPPESRGTAIGVQQVFNIAGAGLGAALGGAASQAAGVWGVVTLTSLLGLAASAGPLTAHAIYHKMK